MTKEALEKLLEKYSKGDTTLNEQRIVEELLDKYVADKNASTLLATEQKEQLLDDIQWRILREINTTQYPNFWPEEHFVSGSELECFDEYNGSDGTIGGNSNDDTRPLENSSKKRLNFIRYIAAAALILAVGIGLYIYLGGNLWQPSTSRVVAFTPKSKFVTPGNTSASILLADGKKVPLDSAMASRISKIQVGVNGLFLVDLKGHQIQLDKTAGLNVYSSLVTERGQQAPEMTLADGTKVWLNAASSLRFPVKFGGTFREVELSGEAYFEVAHDAAHPFIVHTNGSDIKVLGTHFNIMTYKDEDYTYATLLNGSIQLTNGQHKILIKPGQQAIVNQAGNIKVKNVDVDQAVAWLHGKLPMNNMEVHQFLREVSRWYDVDITYTDTIAKQTFSGNLNRQVPLNDILEALKVNGVNARLENRTIIVSKEE